MKRAGEGAIEALVDIDESVYAIESVANQSLDKQRRVRGRFEYNITKESVIGLHPMRSIFLEHRCVQFLGRTVDQVVDQEYTARRGDVRLYKMTDLKYDIRSSWITLTQPFAETIDHRQSSTEDVNKMTCVCCLEDCSQDDGLSCDCGVFICGRSSNGCLANHVISSISYENIGRFIEHQGKIRCMLPCEKAYDDWKIAQLLRSVHYTQYQTAQINILEGKISRDIEAEYEERLQIALNSSKTHDDQVKEEMRAYISQNILTLKCPEKSCGQAFVDFDACCALECSRCQEMFCAWCLKSFKKNRNACHRHIGKCQFNIAPFKSLFTEEATINKAWNARRTEMLDDYLAKLPIDHVKIAISECEPYLKELGIKMARFDLETQSDPVQLYSDQLDELVNMGFTPDRALCAITKSKGDLQDAVANLLEPPAVANLLEPPM